MAIIMGVAFVMLVYFVEMYLDDPEYQRYREVARYTRENIKRERNPKPKRGYRYVYAGTPMKRK